ncbi:amino acid adenylation domain-containing protein [Actinokineospora alba]|uniref:Amino acid adenylation domain-containing protein n=1 Tax=Actinokineospora alba TaxID=504798 RepID=A0A1H0R728_9PSEU|nr:AMP-binding protein [Actinokineospora alba]TDP70222.1 amino acid adenylation domain-containing protein [Actinokineospora alba]SDI36503.1 amino acid adenylation domain-containing protein [Actinokineospora alba]SDP25225.1 amino acid adenylation domain-containing protein [Actinokineospora alba]
MRPTDRSAPRSLVHRFQARAARRPGATALVWRHTEVDYGGLHRLARAAYARLDALGLPPGAPVGVLAAKSPDAIALVLALLAQRRPFLLPSPTLAEPTLRALFAQAGCVAVLSTEQGRPLVDHVIATDGDGPELPTASDPDEVGFMLTTSGSTGLPKVVPLSTGATARFADWAAAEFDIGPHRTVLSYAPLNFDLSLLDLWTTLAAGGRVVLAEADHSTRGAYLLDLLVAHEVNVVQAVPMFFQLLADHTRTPVSTVDHVIVTGDVLPERCLAALPDLFPNARLHNLYGCTETNDSFLHEIDPGAGVPVPLGKPISGVDAVLVDSDGAVIDGPGVGELHVRTPFQTAGYLDPALDADRFGPGPGGRAGRYFRSGDLVRRHPDGQLTLEGRTDFQVKVRGVRINPQEVERVLLAHPDVAEAAVLALPDPVAGTALHAFVGRRDRSLNSLAVRKHCADRLPRQAIPSAVHLLDTPLPRTATGKPDRARITRDHVEKGT